jgi:predicted TPR repeat methyltransferase
VSEWKLFDEIPYFATPEFFAAHPWIEPAHQIGHAERMQMVLSAILRLHNGHLLESLCDLGCGDGTLLRLIRSETQITRLWGITQSQDDIDVAWSHDLNVAQGNFLPADIHWADVTVMTEVLEHLIDPHGFLRRIESQYLIASSPSAETDKWHYEHHTWAWDTDGYAKMIANAGFKILDQAECMSEKTYDHGTGLFQPLRFQVIVAQRNGES